MHKKDFGKDFHWGVSTAAYQIEGAFLSAGKGPSIWDEFSNTPGKIYRNQNGNVACDHFYRFKEDVQILKELNIPNYRFSIAWSRLLPNGIGKKNKKGFAFYDRLIDNLLKAGIEPWVTLYHWDLPLFLERAGGWKNPDVVSWFLEYSEHVLKAYGDRVKHWMVLNEPMVFTGAGYFLGIHAPGRRGMSNFIPAMHHATLAQAEGGRLVRDLVKHAQVGTTFSCSYIEPIKQESKHIQAATRMDALLNRLFVEPAMGMGYPLNDLPALKRVEKWMKPGDESKLDFDFDFIGVQNYTREVVKYSPFTPYIQADLVSAKNRKLDTTLMGWEVYPESIYHMLKKFQAYDPDKTLIVTESGAAFKDHLEAGFIHDVNRINYLKSHLEQIQRAQFEGIKVKGFFVWTLMDNFEWAEGYKPRFGLVYVDFKNQKRVLKDSAHWYKSFIS